VAVSQQTIMNFFYGNGNINYHLWTGFFLHKGLISTVKGVKFITARMSLVGYYFSVNVHGPTEHKNDDTKDSFYEELERVLDQFSK
jgi:hypothetical protein